MQFRAGGALLPALKNARQKCIPSLLDNGPQFIKFESGSASLNNVGAEDLVRVVPVRQDDRTRERPILLSNCVDNECNLYTLNGRKAAELSLVTVAMHPI